MNANMNKLNHITNHLLKALLGNLVLFNALHIEGQDVNERIVIV